MRDLLKAIVESDGLVVALLLVAAAYAVRQISEIVMARVEERRRRGRFFAALYAEIAYNTADLRRFHETAAPPEVLAAAIKRNATNAAHMTDARHVAIYQSGAASLTELPRSVIGDVVAFYSQLEKIKAQTDALRWESFQQISDAGRLQVLKQLWSTILDGSLLGERAMDALKAEGETAWALGPMTSGSGRPGVR